MGQVTRDSRFGKALTAHAARSDINKILDIGTWNGQGTTECLVYGAQFKYPNKDLSIVSVEANKKYHEIACKYYSQNKPPFLHLLHGTLTKEIMTPTEVQAHPLFDKVKTHYDLHYMSDIQSIINSPEIDFENAKVDMVVLDGGEFCGKADFRCCLKLMPKIIALDDINVIKNRDNYNLLLKNKAEWVLVDSGEDRNGWAIFRRNHKSSLEEILKTYTEKYGDNSR
jgi:hypothetical protein